MIGIKQLNMLVLSIMASITIMNMGLVLNFVTASGQALTALSSQTIFLFAAVELAAVLTAYVLYKQKTTSIHS